MVAASPLRTAGAAGRHTFTVRCTGGGPGRCAARKSASFAGCPPLVWTVDTAGNLNGELPPLEGLPFVGRVKQLTVWADCLGIDLVPTDAGAWGSRQFTPDSACGVTVRVSVATPGWA